MLGKILVVEDSYSNLEEIEKTLDGKEVEILWGRTQEEAQELFYLHEESLDLIIMDACVPGSRPNTMDLIKEVLESGFRRPIIAVSTISAYIPVLIKAGATHESVMGRWGAARLALELLSKK